MPAKAGISFYAQEYITQKGNGHAINAKLQKELPDIWPVYRDEMLPRFEAMAQERYAARTKDAPAISSQANLPQPSEAMAAASERANDLIAKMGSLAVQIKLAMPSGVSSLGGKNLNFGSDKKQL